MDKYVGFLHYRGGSTLFQYLCNSSSKGGFLPVVSNRCAVRTTNCGNIPQVFLTESHQPFLALAHIGNWWGNKPSSEVPMPYEDPSPMKWDVRQLELLPGSGWKFFNLIRDGRNLTASLYNLKGGIEESLRDSNADDYFMGLCMAFRNKARIALDCEKYLENYKVFKFEDIMADTVGAMREIYSWLGFELDEDVCSQKAEDIAQRRVGKHHTSFKTKSIGDLNTRWRSWSSKQVEIFRNIAGQELIELGYEKDDSW